MFAKVEPLPPGWASIRAGQLARFPVCQDCGAAPATEVHHVRGRAAGHRPGNLRSLCHSCHATITGREGGASSP
jgi:5-methylcytosine-specific restriction endonuclease McrA